MGLLITVCGIMLALLFANALVHLIFAVTALRMIEHSPPMRVDPAELPGNAERFETRTASGESVGGIKLVPERREPVGVVLFCPEAFGDARSALNYTGALLEHQLAVVSVDFRRECLSRGAGKERPNHWCTMEEVEDTEAVLDYIARDGELGRLPVAMFGVCRGASAVLAVGAFRPEVRGVLCQGAFTASSLQAHFSRRWLDREFGRWSRWIPHWHSRVTMWLTRKLSEVLRRCRYVHIERSLPAWSDRPVLFISAGNDGYVPAEISRRLCLQTGHDPERDQWLVPGAKHNRERQTLPEEYDRRVVQFLTGCLLSCKPVKGRAEAAGFSQPIAS